MRNPRKKSSVIGCELRRHERSPSCGRRDCWDSMLRRGWYEDEVERRVERRWRAGGRLRGRELKVRRAIPARFTGRAESLGLNRAQS